MDELARAESATGRHALDPAESAVPAMPVMQSIEEYGDVPHPLVGGLPRMIGWQWKPASKGGPAFVLLKPGALGSPKVVERFPLTQEGWASAWRAYVRESPESAEKCRAQLRVREREERELGQRFGQPAELVELDSRSLACLRQVALLGGYAPEAAIAIGERYDARFLEDRLGIFPRLHWEPLAEVPYSEVEDVEIGGPGLVRSGGGFVGGGFGAVGALEGMAVAGVLNALTTRTSITTIIRVQAVNCELFLLHTKSAPEQLRIQLSRALGAIRAAKATAAQSTQAQSVPTRPASAAEELTKLASLLQAGLLTREEFDQFKARLLQQDPTD
jgi:hypothetical protein